MNPVQPLKQASASYVPQKGMSPFMAATHFAQNSTGSGAHGLAQWAPNASKVKFGNAGVALSPLTQHAYKIFGPIWRNRGVELLAIDLIGWCGIRTAMDLYREFFFKKTIDNQPKINKAAGQERVLMELMGSAPDSIGLMAAGVGMLAERKMNAFSKQFVDLDTLEYFKSVLGNKQNSSTTNFINHLAHDISAPHAAKIAPMLEQAILKNADPEKIGASISKMLGQTHMDRVIQNNTFALDTLIGDAKAFISHLPKNNAGFGQQAQNLIKKTIGINWVRIPLGVAVGVLFNFSAPYLIQALTRKTRGINDFPGEAGLRKLHEVDEKKDKKRGLLPYLKESMKRGNFLPLLISLSPLPVIFGMIDTEKVASEGIKAAFNNPMKKGFWGRFMKMMQYSRSFPFAGPQQMAMLYALVVFSRVASARNGVEFRERTVDAFLAWNIWILFTPWMKTKVSQLYDKYQGTQLMKTVNGVTTRRSESEILKMIADKNVASKTLSKFVGINVASIVGTILLLGIAEPWLSIKLTELQSRWMTIRRKQLQAMVAGKSVPQNDAQKSPSMNYHMVKPSHVQGVQFKSIYTPLQ